MVTSRNRSFGSVLALLCGAGGISALRADTVALWNFEKDAVWGDVDLRCAVNAANGFSANGNIGVTDQSVGWYLPPNPDESVDAFSSGNRYALSTQKKGLLRLASSEMSDFLDLRHDFTLEGWMKPVFDPAGGYWYIVANMNNGSSGGRAGTIWSLRTGANANLGLAKGQVRFEVFWAEKGDQMVSAVFTDEQVDELTNAWHHVALVFDYENEAGVSEYSFYYDGAKMGSTSRAKRTADEENTNLTGTFYALELFGRKERENVLYGQYDYWRLSDAVLTPEQFLCAGGTGTSAPPASSTVGYWPLGVDADGNLDVRDYAGAADLNTGLKGVTAAGVTANERSTVLPCRDRAFAGQPPNTAATLPSANTGCVAIRSAGRLIAPGLGTSLETKNSFTVEGWFKPEERDGVAAAYQATYTRDRYHYLFNTRSVGNGWVLQYNDGNKTETGGRRYFQLIVEDPDGEASTGDPYLVERNFSSSGFGPGRVDWMHVALVYDHTEGTGTWRLYVDGIEWGAVTNAHAPVGLSGGTDFMIGGRGGEAAFGYLDCVRVSQAALTPNQFLCATENPAAATDVLAFWPLDSQDGVSFDLSDVAGEGAYTLAPPDYQTAACLPVAVTDDRPVITNPDTSVNLRSGVADVQGCLAFDGARSFLQTTDATVNRLLGGRQDFTFEFYAKQFEKVSGWDIFLAVSWNAGGTNLILNLTYRADKGIVLLDWLRHPNDYSGDTTITNTLDFLSLNAWHHVAMTVAHPSDGSGNVVFRFYLDGKLVSQAEGTFNNQTNPVKTYFFGRDYSFNTFDGRVSSVRLSNRVLEPDEFLCATPASPEDPDDEDETEPQTLAYWAFDGSAGTVETADRTGNGYRLTASSAAGSADAAVATVPNPDRTLPETVCTNAGSLALDRSAATVPNLGLHLTYNRAFTVEGWLKWTRGENTWPETLFGTYGPYGDAGWKVYVDVSGETPVLRLLAKHLKDWTPVADGVLCADISDWNGAWHHLALSYDPAAGTCGRWTLRVDGADAGTVDNDWCNPRRVDGFNRFAFGSDPYNTAEQTGFTGYLDHWRVSSGVVAKEDLLRTQHAFIFTIR